MGAIAGSATTRSYVCMCVVLPAHPVGIGCFKNFELELFEVVQCYLGAGMPTN